MRADTDIVEQLRRRAHNGIQPMNELARLDMLAAAAEITRLRAALAQAGAGREPVGVLERGEGGAFKVRADMDNLPAIYSLPAGLHPLFAHPSPAQREPLSDAQIDSAPALTLADHSALVGRRELRQFARQIGAACAAAWGVKLADSGTTSGTKGAAHTDDTAPAAGERNNAKVKARP